MSDNCFIGSVGSWEMTQQLCACCMGFVENVLCFNMVQIYVCCAEFVEKFLCVLMQQICSNGIGLVIESFVQVEVAKLLDQGSGFVWGRKGVSCTTCYFTKRNVCMQANCFVVRDRQLFTEYQ
eukprot:TRINITY_DN7009_c0_g1_i1.p2 TRINITY_DN7009_c0_g1~~TRINITY_DN7009_c0_g1_i1.p2  ORF type:complete len:123 (-),score=6.01 TRINITY_DN7009_c0_g1_i1:174-542(-)